MGFSASALARSARPQSSHTVARQRQPSGRSSEGVAVVLSDLCVWGAKNQDKADTVPSGLVQEKG